MDRRHVRTMVTAFRDGFQSVFGGRVATADMLPAIEAARDAGICHFEAGGGARFQALYFYCNEDAFAMMDAFRRAVGPDANLQTLARGINVVGLESQPREVIALHARLFKKHGVTTIRNFDALNDVRNLVYSGRQIVEAGLRHEVSVTMMGLPPGLAADVHTAEYYTSVLRTVLDAEVPFDSVCFKDASGTSTLQTVYETVRSARMLLGADVPIVFHTHETAGTAVAAYLAALNAGADQIDLSLAPVSGGSSQPDLITMWQALRGSEFDLGVDIRRVMEAEEVFKECLAEYDRPAEARSVEPLVPFGPMPGGALTANTNMMREAGVMDRYPEVAAAMEEVVARGGFGTSVTPVSQFYFQQAFNNVMVGPWQRIAEGYGKMVLGYFGRTPKPPDDEIVRAASEQLGLPVNVDEPLDRNDADSSRSLEAARSTLLSAGIADTEENVFIVATCREKGIAFLRGDARVSLPKRIDPISSAADSATAGRTAGSVADAGTQRVGGVFAVNVDGHDYRVVVDGDHVEVDGVPVAVHAHEAADHERSPASYGHPPEKSTKKCTETSTNAAGDRVDVRSPLPGAVLRIERGEGAAVAKGDALLVLESMKMETPIVSPCAGRVTRIPVVAGATVAVGDLLAEVAPSGGAV